MNSTQAGFFHRFHLDDDASGYHDERRGKPIDYLRVCYVTNWAQYRPGKGRFTPDNIDPTLCTHIVFAFAVIGKNLQLKSYEWNDESTPGVKGM